MRHRSTPAAPRHRAGPAEERSLKPLVAFVGSLPRPDTPLEPPCPEIAFVGRSNVGKSSLINAVAAEPVARVSGTPGKTRALTVFRVSAAGRRAYYLLDLPGYGYARLAHSERLRWRRLLRAVVTRRPHLAGVVWLLDLRRDPSPDDVLMRARYGEASVRVLAALTKADKVPRGQRRVRVSTVREALALEEDQVLVTSARTGEGIDELRQAIAALAAAAGSREPGAAA